MVYFFIHNSYIHSMFPLWVENKEKQYRCDSYIGVAVYGNGTDNLAISRLSAFIAVCTRRKNVSAIHWQMR
ncbi:hypothetical protein [Photobacterium damselae]|uniref:hypothetical protein n=2 Tax=Photobacterium damselae TaxID=38293 RepID=UPI00114D2AD8|nr:hypothetical protein [Photobacterium damselae]MBA5683462.1 hypothetical protein [Photobacterium damselae subsp. damselae]MCG9778340.1 hypothetical protein [Photobacterium damselae]UJZ96394.1 hypothetical protein IHC87_17665 [Photobacterium damselae subsp. damselae]UJZ99701.1 hypothetical protein IHC88_19825 [Photobacterium damselae subsp. damselae]